MYIYLGGERVVRSEDLIAILNVTMKQSTSSAQYNDSEMINYDNVQLVDDKTPKSLVITKHKMYYSSISVTTLAKRLK